MIRITLMASSLFYINEPVSTMRESPNPHSEVVSQAVFSEEVHIQASEGKWSRIETPDGYSGWVLTEHLVKRETPFVTNAKISRVKAHLYTVMDTIYGPIKSLPYGARFTVLNSSDARWLKIALPDDLECYVQKGDAEELPQLRHKNKLPALAQQFRELPYTWGGRSSFGYDCSGFVQMLYSHIDISLQRDAKQQILDKRFKTIDIAELEPGDLIFFGKSEERILHVGMSIGDGQFIHATSRENKPWIRISNLSDFEWSGDEKANYPHRHARQLIETMLN